MTKHREAFASRVVIPAKCFLLTCAVVTGAFCSAQRAYAVAEASICTSATQSEVDAVFNQAVSTVSSLANAAVKAQARGSWHPTGSFRKVFFLQSGRALRSIRALLGGPEPQGPSCVSSKASACTTNPLPKSELLQTFDQIFSIPFPKGLRSLRRLQRVERDKFTSAVEALPDNYITCG